MSPSIHPLPSVPRPAGSVALPSGLGAGGRGKEKAPCRYVHYEVDITTPIRPKPVRVPEIETEDFYQGASITQIRKPDNKPKRTHRIELGLGPVGKGYQTVDPINRIVRGLTLFSAPSSVAQL